MSSFDTTNTTSRHLSFPSEDSSDHIIRNSDVLGLADTGRMISNALSDSFLTSIGVEDCVRHSILTNV